LKYYDGIEEKELRAVNKLRIEITPENPNYKSYSRTVGLFVHRSETVLPAWFWVLASFTAGSALLIAGYGLRKALQLRIPYVLRMIDESIDKITADKFPSVGVMLGRREFVINKVIDYLDEVGIEWEISDKFQEEELGDEGEEGEEEDTSKEGSAPMDLKELTLELNRMAHLGPDDRELFLDELKRLNRKEQEEFLKSLREESGS